MDESSRKEKDKKWFTTISNLVYYDKKDDPLLHNLTPISVETILLLET